jgi:hypothetical protein
MRLMGGCKNAGGRVTRSLGRVCCPGARKESAEGELGSGGAVDCMKPLLPGELDGGAGSASL